PRWRVCRGRTRNAGCGKPASRAGRDPAVGKHGGASGLAQFSRISGCTQDWREIREIQHRRGEWRKTVVARQATHVRGHLLLLRLALRCEEIAAHELRCAYDETAGQPLSAEADICNGMPVISPRRSRPP